MHDGTLYANEDPSQVRVLLVHDRYHPYIDGLRKRFPTVDFEIAATPEAVSDALASHRPQAVFSCKSPGMPGPCHRPVVEATDVKWVQVAGAGFDHLQPIHRSDLVISNSGGVLSQFMGETVLGAMLMLNFRFQSYFRHQVERRWQQEPWTPLQSKRVLIIGLGHIGVEVARHAKHLGMHVSGLRRTAKPTRYIDQVITPDQLHATLARCDVLCLHVPLTGATREMIGGAEFAAMKRGIIIVNTARGGVVDEQALLAALADGTVAGAHLDVFAEEPLPPSSPLWAAPNLVISPHMADSVADFETRFAAFFADNLERWLAGQPVLNQVDPAAGY